MYSFVTFVVSILKRFVPDWLVRPLRPAYHRTLAILLGASYGFPARRMTVLGVTGTKGKSTTAEMLFTILTAAGYKTALASTIRFAIGAESEPNLFKMTVPGRGYLHAFMRKAKRAGCTHVVVEITSESVLQYRHWFLSLDGLIVTNIQREHIESHGSFEKYVAAKRAIVGALEHSRKKERVLIMNDDDAELRKFLPASVTRTFGFSHEELENTASTEREVSFDYLGTHFILPLPGYFNALNALAAIKLCAAFGIPLTTSAAALLKLPPVQGRVEHIDAGQDFIVIVDYAHTPDSLTALYSAFPNRRKICVLGNTGGGRDRWKRPLMGALASEACDEVILTNEDPYDEDPRAIVEEMARDMKKPPRIVMDRREAIRAAFAGARPGDAVLITGKGTDPFIMGAKGTKTPWSDASVAREELALLQKKS